MATRVSRTQGTMLGFLVAEDEVMRGERERPGPAARWNAEGTVCE